MAPQQSGAVATASDDERPLARRDDEEHTPVAAGEGGDDGDPEAPAAGRRRRGLRRSLILLAAIAVAAAAGIAATGALGGDGSDAGSAAPTAPPATAKVQRTTLTDTQTVDGNLGYGSATTVQAPAAQSGTGSANGDGQQTQGGGSDTAGIITWLPDEGRVLKRGDAVYRVNEEKIPLLYGSFPLYRTLQTGSEGADVKMLEKNLDALGYDGFTVDDEYTSGTAEAVREWQDDLGREETGTVAPGDAVVASGARRVASLETVPGAAVSGAVLSWTDTERIVSVDLDVAYEDLVDEGTEATVELPDNSTVEAEVTDIGTPTSASKDSGEGGGSGEGGSGGSGSDEATLPVELTVKDPKGLGRYQAAAVEVTLKADSRKNVLAVPVDALMARQGGGYALEVVTDNGTELRPVKLGMFANGMVEVSGTGIEEGTVVGVPK
jgi:hypothetical protein